MHVTFRNVWKFERKILHLFRKFPTKPDKNRLGNIVNKANYSRISSEIPKIRSTLSLQIVSTVGRIPYTRMKKCYR